MFMGNCLASIVNFISKLTFVLSVIFYIILLFIYRKILGLRKVDYMPSFTRDMRLVTTLQDDSFPVVLVMGGLHPREPVNMVYGETRYFSLKTTHI